MGKVVELLTDVVALYLSCDHSVGEQEFEARDFAEVSAMTRELEVAFVVITPGGVNGIGELAQWREFRSTDLCRTDRSGHTFLRSPDIPDEE
jgi:hypothetical protein